MKQLYRPLTQLTKSALGKMLMCLDSDIPCYISNDDEYNTITQGQASALVRLKYAKRVRVDESACIELTHLGCEKAILLRRMKMR